MECFEEIGKRRKIRYDESVFKLLRGVIKLVFLGVAVVGIGFIPWQSRPLKDHALGYIHQAKRYVGYKVYLLSQLEEKKRREVLNQIQKIKKERQQKKRQPSPKESITATEEKRLEEILGQHSK